MKAKDMAVKFNTADDKQQATAEIIADLIYEYGTIADKRKPSTAQGYAAILDELDQKWTAFCYRVDREQLLPIFRLSLQEVWREGYEAWRMCNGDVARTGRGRTRTRLEH